MQSRHCCRNSLERSFVIRRDVWLIFIISMFIEILVFIANSVDLDQTPRSVVSGHGLHCFFFLLFFFNVPFMGQQVQMGLRRRVLRCLVMVYTVVFFFQCPFYGTAGTNGFKQNLCIFTAAYRINFL